ncbi:MAG: DUF4115 domain-containing protein [Anaerolineales bacterium]|jgi:cytoskeletal protein RodZ|nr:DUF4115 domain-containing protein [Anaerolineales bacterium]
MSTSVGQQLRQAREQRSLTIEQAAAATRIRPHYLRSLEAGEFDALPSLTQGRGFLRAYASYLGLDAEPLLSALDKKEAEQTTEADPAALSASNQGDSTTVFDDREASAIFTEVGQKLRQQRELLGLSLEDIERHTHLRQRYLQALEEGRLEGLPSFVQGRGMLDIYADFLGLDGEAMLLRFAEGLQARLAARQAAQQPAKTASRRRRRWPPRWLRRFLSGDILIGGALTLFLGLFVIWAAIRIFAQTSKQTPSPTAPSIAEALLATAAPSDTPTPQPSPTPVAQVQPLQPQATDPQTGALISPAPNANVQVGVNVRQRAWMRVTVDGKVEFEGRVIPGSAYTFAGASTIEILTSSGSALQVFVNGADLGPMGGFGQVVNRIYSPQGVLTPTPTITPTPAPTQPATPTVIPLATEAGQITPPTIP